jgi:hypothetical protein
MTTWNESDRVLHYLLGGIMERSLIRNWELQEDTWFVILLSLGQYPLICGSPETRYLRIA